jgi:diguanylate cyclase (GGDEF)-like protein/PAS domain S-box-containing protein
VEAMGDTAELAVCTRWDDKLLRCLPTRLELAPLVLPVRNSRGDLYPMVHAIDGQSGVARIVDRNEQSALVAYGPIGTLRLGMILKISTDEMFHPIRDRLPYLLLWVGLLVAAGSFLVRAQVYPLAARILRSEREAKRNEARLHTVTDNVPALISFLDAEQRFQFVNKAHEAWFGQNLAEISGKTLKEVVGEEDYALRKPQIEAVLRGERYSAERHREINGKDVWLEIVYIPEFDDFKRVIGFFVLGHDITDRKLNEARLETMALKDPLTGLANRRLFAERVEQAVAHARRNKGTMGVLFVDLDGFKQVNDTLGHDAGDLLLKGVAERLVAAVRQEDTVGRMGGDEFAIALGALRGADDARIVAEKIIASLSRPFAIQQQAVNISASVGVGVFPDHGKNAESLLKNADLAMYEAKRAGKNTYRVIDLPDGSRS